MRNWYSRKTAEEKKEMLKQRDIDRVRRADKARYHDNPDRRAYVKEKAKDWGDKNPLSRKAQYAVSNAVRDGRLEKKPCEQASDGTCHGVINAHHDDYSKPLEVRWLCRSHHMRWHAENGPGKKVEA